MWNLHNTSCSTLCAWATPPPASIISFDDHRHHDDNNVHPINPSSSSLCEDDAATISTSSFTNTSGHSVLTAESSHQPPAETTASSSCNLMNGGDHNSSHDHLWSHLLLSNIDTCEDLHKCDPYVRENLLDAVPVMKGASTDGILEQAACDYLKKLENSYCNDPLDKDFFGSDMSSFIDCGRLSKVSDSLFGDWSTATPNESNYTMHVLSDYAPRGMVVGRDSDQYLCKGLDNPNIESKKPYRTAAGKYTGIVGLHHDGIKASSCGSARSLADLISISSRLISKPSLDVKVPRPGSSPNMKKQGPKSTTLTRGNEGKRKRSDRGSSSTKKLQKKHGHGNATVTSSSKARSIIYPVTVPKVKLGDRIATLQQIVSPFGKTDTASVLMEAIQYIKFLQEQVQLLISNPYMKTHPHREHPWGGNEVRLLDLRSRGLCLIPVSCAPQVCRDNTACDYWTPTYRGVFYR